VEGADRESDAKAAERSKISEAAHRADLAEQWRELKDDVAAQSQNLEQS
jgi:hypothetical protein